MTKRALASLMCPYCGEASKSLIRCAEPRSARLRAARAKGSQKPDRSGAQRTPGELPKKPQRGHRRAPQRSPRELPEDPPRESPEDLPSGPKRRSIWDPCWCQNVWFSTGFTIKTKTCAIMEREARNVQERQYAGNTKDSVCQSMVMRMIWATECN